MPDDISLGRNELLARACDRAVLRGQMVPAAAADLVEMFADKCEIESANDTVLLNGKSLDQAVLEIVKRRPHWQPREDAAAPGSAQAELEASALAGNLTAQGRLLKEWGTKKFVEWKANAKRVAEVEAEAEAARAADAAAASPEAMALEELVEKALAGNITARGQLFKQLGVEKFNALMAGGKLDLPARAAEKSQTSANPFKDLRHPDTGVVNKQAAERVASLIRAHGTAKATEIANSAGFDISGYPLGHPTAWNRARIRQHSV